MPLIISLAVWDQKHQLEDYAPHMIQCEFQLCIFAYQCQSWLFTQDKRMLWKLCPSKIVPKYSLIFLLMKTAFRDLLTLHQLLYTIHQQLNVKSVTTKNSVSISIYTIFRIYHYKKNSVVYESPFTKCINDPSCELNCISSENPLTTES